MTLEQLLETQVEAIKTHRGGARFEYQKGLPPHCQNHTRARRAYLSARLSDGAVFLLYCSFKIEKSNPARVGGRLLATARCDGDLPSTMLGAHRAQGLGLVSIGRGPAGLGYCREIKRS